MVTEKPILESLTNEELMYRYKLGELEPFNELYRRHAAKVFGYLKTKLGNSSRADDVFQDTFLRVHRFRSRYNPSLPFIPWLFTVCRNAMLDDHRKEKIKTGREISFEDSEATAFLASPNEPILESYLGKLSEREKEILTLHFQGGFSFKELASRLSISPENARKLSSRAIRKLRSIWK